MYAAKSITPPPDPMPVEEIFDRMDAFEIAEPEKCTMSVRLQFPKFAHGFKPSDFEAFIKSMVGAENVVSLGRLSFPNEWQLALKTKDSREKLIRMGRTKVNGRTCWIHPLSHSEIRGYVHWLPTEIPDEKVKEKLRVFGEVLFMEVQNLPKWTLPIKSDSRYFALYLRPGTAADDLPHFITIYGFMGLVTVKGRSPACFHCREIGHKKTECKKYRERLSEYCMRKPKDPSVARKRGRRHDGNSHDNEVANATRKRRREEKTQNTASVVKEKIKTEVSMKVEDSNNENEFSVHKASTSTSVPMDMDSVDVAASGGAKPKKKKKKKKKNKKSSETCKSANISTATDSIVVGAYREIKDETLQKMGHSATIDSMVPGTSSGFVSKKPSVVSCPFNSVLISNFEQDDSCSSCAASVTMEMPASSLDFSSLFNKSDIAVIGECSTTEVAIATEQTTSSLVDIATNSALTADSDNVMEATGGVSFRSSGVLYDEATSEVTSELTSELSMKDSDYDIDISSCDSNPLSSATIKSANSLKVESVLSEDSVDKTSDSKLSDTASCFVAQDHKAKGELINAVSETCNDNLSGSELNLVKEILHTTSNAQNISNPDSVFKLSETLQNVTIEESEATKSQEFQEEPKSAKKDKKKRKKKRKTTVST